MTLRDLLQVMNVYEVEVCGGYGIEKLQLRGWETSPIVKLYGDRKVREITDIAHMGITIWLE